MINYALKSEVAIMLRLQLQYALPVTQHYKRRTVQEISRIQLLQKMWVESMTQPEGSRITLSQIDTLRCQRKELKHEGGQR